MRANWGQIWREEVDYFHGKIMEEIGTLKGVVGPFGSQILSSFLINF
jgi:hypothetical protein